MLRTVAVSLTKICNDLRWMGSGPRAGLGEIALPDLQPGSSIMPGKVNPVLCEATDPWSCAQVIGNDAAVTFSGAAGSFELNVMLPVMARNVLESIRLLAAASAGCFADRCVDGITANVEHRARTLAESCPSIVTPLNRYLGYENGGRRRQDGAQGGQDDPAGRHRKGVRRGQVAHRGAAGRRPGRDVHDGPALAAHCPPYPHLPLSHDRTEAPGVDAGGAGGPGDCRPRLGAARQRPGSLPYGVDAGSPPVPSDTTLPDGVALVVGTSGSSGPVKLAMLTADSLTASATATHDALGGPGSWLLALPPTHIAGLQVISRTLVADSLLEEVDATEGFTPDRFALSAAKLAANAQGRRYTALVPTQLTRILEDPAATRGARRVRRRPRRRGRAASRDPR